MSRASFEVNAAICRSFCSTRQPRSCPRSQRWTLSRPRSTGAAGCVFLFSLCARGVASACLSEWERPASQEPEPEEPVAVRVRAIFAAKLSSSLASNLTSKSYALRVPCGSRSRKHASSSLRHILPIGHHGTLPYDLVLGVVLSPAGNPDIGVVRLRLRLSAFPPGTVRSRTAEKTNAHFIFI